MHKVALSSTFMCSNMGEQSEWNLNLSPGGHAIVQNTNKGLIQVRHAKEQEGDKLRSDVYRKNIVDTSITKYFISP